MMEAFFVTQILLAIAILNTFFSIMLFLMICLPVQVTKSAWLKLKQQESEMGSRFSSINLYCPQTPDGNITCDYHECSKCHGEHLPAGFVCQNREFLV